MQMEISELDEIATRYVNWSQASPRDRLLSRSVCAVVFVGWMFLPAILGSEGKSVLIPINHAVVGVLVTWYTVGKFHYRNYSRPSFRDLSEAKRVYIAQRVKEQLGDDFDDRVIIYSKY